MKEFPNKLPEQVRSFERQYSDIAENISSFLHTCHGGKLTYFRDAYGEVETGRFLVKFLDSIDVPICIGCDSS